MIDRIIVAAAQYPIHASAHWDDHAADLSAYVADGAATGAALLVLPEYASMVLTAVLDAPRVLGAQIEAMQALLPAYQALHAALAREHGIHLLAGSFPTRRADGSYVNRAWLFAPDGAAGYQDKLVMTRFENESWGISPGAELRVFDTALGALAIAICYDCEFPLLARAQAEAGAELLLVPSCTDTVAGYHRVRYGAQARALENQIHVVQAVTVGEAPWSDALDVNIGAAAIYTPVDRGFPPDGIAAIGTREAPGWVHATVDLALARALRRDGQVLNYRDWERQGGLVTGSARRVALR